MPVWVDFTEEIYGLPDSKGRGFKVAGEGPETLRLLSVSLRRSAGGPGVS
jgi:hypothetical protein